MKTNTRRDFLKKTIVGGCAIGASSLTGCLEQKKETVRPRQGKSMMGFRCDPIPTVRIGVSVPPPPLSVPSTSVTLFVTVKLPVSIAVPITIPSVLFTVKAPTVAPLALIFCAAVPVKIKWLTFVNVPVPIFVKLPLMVKLLLFRVNVPEVKVAFPVTVNAPVPPPSLNSTFPFIVSVLVPPVISPSVTRLPGAFNSTFPFNSTAP